MADSAEQQEAAVVAEEGTAVAQTEAEPTEAAEEQAPVEAPTEATEEAQASTNGEGQTVEPTEEAKTGEESKADNAEDEQQKVEDDEDDRKLFVGGLSWETQTNTLRDHMSQFGEVSTCTIKIDNKTGRSRCFGFVIFKEAAGLNKALENKPHKVDGREIDAKKAEPQRKEGKLFVGGVKPETSDDVIKEYFSKFGAIDKLERPFDQKNSKPKGFCFVTFAKDGPIAKITPTRYHELDGKKVECKHAEPPSRGFGGGRGGRDGGGGRGGMGGWNHGGFGGGGFGGYGGGFQGGYGGGFQGGFGGGFQGGYGGYGGGFGGGGGYNQGFGGGYGGGGGFGGGFGGGGGGGGGYGFGQQPSGYGKSGGRGRHQSNYKPY